MSEENAVAQSEPKHDLYVHLANGDVLRLTAKEWAKMQDESGSPHAVRKDGMEHTVIGVYQREVKHPVKDEEE